MNELLWVLFAIGCCAVFFFLLMFFLLMFAEREYTDVAARKAFRGAVGVAVVLMLVAGLVFSLGFAFNRGVL